MRREGEDYLIERKESSWMMEADTPCTSLYVHIYIYLQCHVYTCTYIYVLYRGSWDL